jgi:glycine cleavage system aminomethyltransferase T
MLISPLDLLARRAGAVMIQRAGRDVAAHYGSPAGELSVCAGAVGLADLSWLRKLELRGASDVLDGVIGSAAGVCLAPGEVTCESGVWWARVSAHHTIVLCPPGEGSSSVDVGDAALQLGASVVDVTSVRAAIGLYGRYAGRVLAALGVDDGPFAGLSRSTAARAAIVLAIPVHLIRPSRHQVIMMVDRDDAERLWHLIESAGRPFGLSLVGADAAARYALLERDADRRITV